MKKTVSLFLALVLLICNAFPMGITALAQEEDYDAPDDIRNFQVEQISKNSIKLSWYCSDWSFVSSQRFEIAEYIPATNQYRIVANISASNKDEYTYTVENLKAATKYGFAIRGLNVADGVTHYSAYSDVQYAFTSPNEPQLKSVSYVSQGKINVTWSKVNEASGYLIEYCTNTKFKNDGTTCHITASKNTTSKTISALAQKTYYVRVCAYISFNGNNYCSDFGRTKSIAVKSGVSLKSMINSIPVSSESRNYIKKFTDNGVDINKYKTTYDKFKAIYDWHSKHNTDYGWSCVGCNSNFNTCIAELFKDQKKYDLFIYLACDNFKNSNGSVVMHKWSVIYFSGVPYIFDPRIQGYSSNKTGTTYFGVAPNSTIGKKYLFDGWYGTFPTTFEPCSTYDNYMPYFNFPFVESAAKPAMTTLTATGAQACAKLKWNKVGGITGYQIQYSAKSDFSNAKVVTVDKNATSKNITALGSNKTYYIRIRTFRGEGASAVYGYWSDSVKIKTRHINEANPTSIRKLNAKSKGFKASWKKVSNASGYEVQYSPNKNFKKAKSKKFAGKDTTSKTISKLSSRTKYYVRVRTYRTVNGKKYYSAWSKAKTVKTK